MALQWISDLDNLNVKELEEGFFLLFFCVCAFECFYFMRIEFFLDYIFSS